MSGHSKWSTIKHKKGALDAKRGKLFTKLSKEIIVAAREGSDPEMNFRLRLAIQNAKASNMPSDNIERSIKKGSGEDTSGATYEEITYEGYGPGGTAFILQALTDNKNRTAAEVRSCFSKNGGNLAESGAVSWNFETKGVIDVNADKDSVEEISMEGIDAGAIDVDVDEANITFYTTYQDFENVKKFLEANDSVSIDRSEIELVPNTFADVDKTVALKTMKLLEKLEDLDDIQKVFSNLEITNELIDDFE
ncbi:MAG: YebC/PmpR family DNA-binding transcriptional regulator [Chloroflexota bacterium]|jgi:YebC/PmpR family DNA-binding regulatory protein|nr:YebC/PmpR family DNA-binding transcriptional regulator [Chloroflexota bacterium]MEC7156518.1 YebC/PmpR family DNA-binding transcriptional regulator [Chloroflexota bacterium]MEC8713503.1 YebC/PmpR family DNA-binding transcriptional regulator [Chloroflexota bacterium]MEC8750099.1 YebC/PmpR family DNA-binding transcriptional regulator [Chloroflexota bacterium]MEE2620987.1 YebC/PmpR family DNA-binding transcriptional regulator [Chloroflexota bacterium]|tara:strand:+ start:778 stop:1527 length:750 start_codon:yes stop_codon:yes gene_type:complete